MAQNDTTRKFNALLYVLARLTFLPYLTLKYRVKSENKAIFKTLKPPFILIPNHVSIFDPPIVNIFVPHRVHFVMSDANLRSKIAKWAFGKLCRVIPKTKAVSDASTVRRILQLARKNRVICVFAEGRSSWDGVSHDIFFSTAKLVKNLQIPVVVPVIRGGYLTHPRWGTSVRPGRMILHYKKVFDGPELEGMTAQTICQRLLAEMWNDDYDYQRRTGQTYKSQKGAEYLERVIFACPVCASRQTMRSEGNRFFCTTCGFETRWTAHGYLEPIVQNGQPKRSVTDWVAWQNELCEKLIRRLQAEEGREPIFSDANVTLKVGYKQEPLKPVFHGQMSLYYDRFVLLNGTGEAKVFPITKIDGVQVLLANQFEFYFEGALYKFDFADPRASGYKYLSAIQKIAPERTELN